jgi:hypothetical protein
MLRVPATRTDELWAQGLLDRGTAVHAGHLYDVAHGSHLVLSLLPRGDVMDRGIAAIEELLADAD